MTKYQTVLAQLNQTPQKWLITGVAGFIGSNLLETLLKNNQIVTGLDNFSTGFTHNLKQVQALVTPQQWQKFLECTQSTKADLFIAGDRDFEEAEALTDAFIISAANFARLFMQNNNGMSNN